MDQQTFESLKFVDEQLGLIDDIAVDYDGCRTAETLCELVDELVDMAVVARRRLNNVLDEVNGESRYTCWICESDGDYWTKWTCPCCGNMTRTDNHIGIGWNYCPMCGVRLFGGSGYIGRIP